MVRMEVWPAALLIRSYPRRRPVHSVTRRLCCRRRRHSRTARQANIVARLYPRNAGRCRPEADSLRCESTAVGAKKTAALGPQGGVPGGFPVAQGRSSMDSRNCSSAQVAIRESFPGWEGPKNPCWPATATAQASRCCSGIHSRSRAASTGTSRR
jgi:hypothetical protein